MKDINIEKKQTLIQAFERLDHKCVQLKELARLTEKLNEKLNRTEGHPECEDKKEIAQKEDNINIVEMFNLIADKIEIQINIIGDNTNYSIQMIE